MTFLHPHEIALYDLNYYLYNIDINSPPKYAKLNFYWIWDHHAKIHTNSNIPTILMYMAVDIWIHLNT